MIWQTAERFITLVFMEQQGTDLAQGTGVGVGVGVVRTA
jgi:hypothetical protein